MITLDLSILNQKGTPMFNSDLFANRPAAGIVGRIFISTDTLTIFRDTGSAWDAIGGGGGGSIGGSIAAGQVAFGTASNTIGGENNFFWDAINDRLGIGINIPTTTIDIRSLGLTIANIRGGSSINQGSAYYVQNSSGNTLAAFGDESAIASGTPDLAAMIYAGSSVPLKFYTGGSTKMTLFSTGNLSINTITDAGYKLDVNGSGRYQDNLLISKNFAGITAISIINSTSNALAASQLDVFANTAAGGVSIGKFSTLKTAYRIISASDSFIWNQTAGDIAILNDFATGIIKFSAGASSTSQMTLFSTGNLAIGTTTDNGFRLDVNGTAEIKGRLNLNTTSNCEFTLINGAVLSRIANSTTGTAIGTLSGHFFAISTAATERMRIFVNGNVSVGSTTDNSEKFQVTGTSAIRDTRTYSNAAIQSFAVSKDLTINSNILASQGVCNYISGGTNTIQSSINVPSSTTFANIFPFNTYQFSSAGLTLTATQPSGGTGIRTISQITTQNVFNGTNSGTITHVSGVQINGFYNNNTSTSTPIITNAYQLLINDTGEFLHTFSFTNRWGIYQVGINDRNYLAGNLLLNSTTDTGQILQVNGAIRVNGQLSGTSGGNSGQHLIINCDGTTYKIALQIP